MAEEIISESDLIHDIADSTGYSKTTVRAIVKKVPEEIMKHVNAGRTVRFIGFGKFLRSFRRPRTATNFETGEQVMTAPKYVPQFKAGSKFKDLVK